MTIKDAEKPIHDLCKRAKNDNDTLLVFYFSRVDDKYQGYSENMDFGDALIVIEKLVRKFGIPAAVLAEMEQHHGTEEKGMSGTTTVHAFVSSDSDQGTWYCDVCGFQLGQHNAFQRKLAAGE